jgi:hypothetical protein
MPAVTALISAPAAMQQYTVARPARSWTASRSNSTRPAAKVPAVAKSPNPTRTRPNWGSGEVRGDSGGEEAAYHERGQP